MTNFDESLVNPDLIESALLIVADEICAVVDMTSDTIIVKTRLNESKTIRNSDWYPIRLDMTWMERLGLGHDMKISDVKAHLDWTVKLCGPYFYLTIDRPNSNNPVIPLHYVHTLQEWIYILRGSNINVDLTHFTSLNN